MCLSKGLGITGSETGTCLHQLSHHLSCSSTLRQGLLYSSGAELNTKIVALVLIGTESHSQSRESGFSKPMEREDWEEPL